jgi:cytochrome c oxidase subunit 2
MRRRSMVALLAGSALGVARLAADTPAEIRISARKFEFHPNTITTRVGRPLTLVLTSEDRIHGFKMPDLGLRADLVPGQETRLTLIPEKPGRFAFLCDVFCGDGHDDMEGTLIVEA